MMLRAFLVVALLCCCAGVPAMAQSPAGALDETVFTVPTAVKDVYGRAISGPTTVPNGRRRSVPAGDRAARPRRSIARFRQEAAAWLVARGFVVLVPTMTTAAIPRRRAAARTSRRHSKRPPPAPVPSSSTPAPCPLSTRAASNRMARQRHRAGGPQDRNFSDPDEASACSPCDAAQLAGVFGAYGAASRVPTLWHTANDKSMGSSAPARWFAAYKDAGGVGEFLPLPAVGDDGHMLFTKGFAVWRPHAEREFTAQASTPTANAATSP